MQYRIDAICRMRKIQRTRILLAIISLIIVTIPVATLPKTHAVLTGEICILASATATSCGTTPPNFKPAAGTPMTVSIFIQGSDALGGSKISIVTDPTKLNPTAISSVGTVVPVPGITLVDCINGVPVPLSGGTCQAGIDGNGVASLGILSLGATTIAPTTGLLFTVTYNVLSTSPAAIDVLVVAGCVGGSVTGTDDCVLITAGAAVDPETLLVGATVNGVADVNALATSNNVFVSFDPTTTSVACTPSTVSISKTSTCTAAVTDTTIPANTPTGSITFIPSPGTTGGSLSANTCTLSAGSCSVTFSGTAPGTATVNATYSGDSTHDKSVAKRLASIIVVLDTTSTAVPKINCNIATGATSCTANVVVTVTDLNTTSNTPTGSVTFTLSAGTTGGSLSAPSCIPTTGSCSVIFTGTTVGSGSVTASYGGDSTHKGSTSNVATITVTKGANFGISSSQSSVTMVVGTTSKINVTFTPISGFTGSITLTNSTTPTVGLALSCNPNPITILSTTPINSTCTITATSAVVYSLTITGTSTSPSLSNSLAAPITVTVTKASPIITTQLVNTTNNQPLGPTNGAATVTVRTSVYDTAAIIGGFFVTGSVTYNLFNSLDCTGSAYPTTVTISNHLIPNLPPYPFNVAGFHGFTATYAGDGNNTATSGTCESLTVNALPVPSFTITNQPVYQAQATSYYLPSTTLSFNAASSYDPDSSPSILSDHIVLAIWTFGDGSGPTIRTTTIGLVNHTYTTVGTYKVTLTLTDNFDGTNSTSHTVITVVPQVKIVSYQLSSTSSTIGDRVKLTVDILNNGLLPLTFNVTMTVASLTAGTAQTVDQQQVSLAPNQENSAITLYWDTRGFSAESYTVVLRLVNARVNGSNGTPVSLLTSSQGAGSVALSPQGTSQLPGGNTLWITIGIVAAVAIILGLTAILLRRRKIPTA